MKITKVAMLILAIAIALYVVFPNLSWAEESVSPQSLPTAISGTVLDPTDNTIAGATVVLQGPGTSDRYTALSNDNGFFEFHGLKSGIPYRVTVHAKGFADWTSVRPGARAWPIQAPDRLQTSPSGCRRPRSMWAIPRWKSLRNR